LDPLERNPRRDFRGFLQGKPGAALASGPTFFEITEVDGKDPWSNVMDDNSQFFFADDGIWFGMML
jgi:hypothetical protein